MKTHDLAVCYRIYPGLSGKPAFGITDKLAMVRLNLQSFKAALGSLKVKVWVILDACPPSYHELVKNSFAGMDLEIIALDKKKGNEATFLRQLGVLANQTEADLVYFVEDDYYHLPLALEKGVRFMQNFPEADFVTLYDHPDFRAKYTHQLGGMEITAEGCQWHMVSSACLTFMARKAVLLQVSAVFATYGRKNSDLGLWLALTKARVTNPWSCVRSLSDGLFFSASYLLAWRHAWRNILMGQRRTLWVPVPSLATHWDSLGLAPNIDWAPLLKVP